MKHTRRVLTLFLVLTFTPCLASAWNDKGHMMVAFLAYQKLTPATRARVAVLLSLNPSIAKWRAMIPTSVPSADRPARLFAIAATWPDQIKSDPTFTDDGSHNGNRPDGASSSLNTGYGDKLRHKYWHFVDQPFSRDGTALPPVPDPNAETRIHLFRSVLALPGSGQDPLKSYDLVWLLHLIGDVHQPLHSATRVRAAQTDGDDGGNAVKVCPRPSCGAMTIPLHAFWDGALGTETAVTAAATAAKQLAQPDAAHAAIANEHEWIRESFELAQGEVYRSPVGAGTGPFALTAKYGSGARALAAKRVALAGARLANLLNNELK